VQVWDPASDREQARWIADGDLPGVALNTAGTGVGGHGQAGARAQPNIPTAASAEDIIPPTPKGIPPQVMGIDRETVLNALRGRRTIARK